MKKEFTSGAQVFIDQLDAQDIPHTKYTTTDYCRDCSGAGCGCHCGDGIVEILVVEYDREPEEFFLWYDNGTDYFDCASKYDTLAEAIKAAGEGYQSRQYITTDPQGKIGVWSNWTVDVFDEMLGHKAVVGLPYHLRHLVQDGYEITK
jgi:hypothetical protein